ncbi:MAG: RluA family pseudouridine synthase [Ruminococcaceae bacterium]|nr:RluA family pseudouridine synthase [Oscillospiraceae bacterium]
MRVFVATANDDGRRVDAFFARLMPAMPKGLLYKYIRTGKIKVNGKKPKPETRLAAGDEVRYFGDDALLPDGPAAPPRAGDITVLYEDEHIALLYKPVRMASQPDARHTADTLVDRFLWYLYKKGAYVPENTFRPALCNRLDYNTHGLVIGAKTAAGLRAMNEKIRTRKVRKLYLCRVEGTPDPPRGRISAALVKDGKTNVSHVGKEGKAAETGYRTLSADGRTSLVEAELFSGRSHQIRVHMASIGCPLVGDPKYGHGGDGQDLCAWRVQFAFRPEGGVLDGLAGKTFTLPESFLKGDENE